MCIATWMPHAPETSVWPLYVRWRTLCDYGHQPRQNGSAIAPGSFLINGLNDLPNPPRYLSVYGAEKARTAVRLASALPESLKEAAGIEGDDETELYDQYLDIRRYYRMARDYWNTLHIASPVISQIRGYKKKANRWQEGERAINKLDRTWAKVIDSYFWERRSGTRSVQVCLPVSGDQCRGGVMCLRDCRPGEDPIRRESYTYYVTIETKNDGAIGPQYAVWSEQDFEHGVYRRNVTETGTNGNAYYGDEGTSAGYNHLELRRSRRAYNGPGFSRGDLNPPIEGAERWLRLSSGTN